MTGKSTPVLFVTANVGSIFEEPTRMVKAWAEEFLSTIRRLDPRFIALHCQEVGGKNYEKSMQYVDDFVKLLLASNELRLFDKVRIYLDEDFTSADKFTALGNFYFIHESLEDVLQYDFTSRSFVDVRDVQVFSQDVEKQSTMEKSKFPLEYFPECKWSRKGYLRTRWSVNGTIFDLVNIHLFHDASNFVAIESFPSEYSETRRQALVFTLERFQADEHNTVPVFIFGDFNFRTDTQAVVNRLSEGLVRSKTQDGTEDSTVDFSDGDGRVLCVGKKTFSHQKHQDVFSGPDSEWLRPYDKELEYFKDQLCEFAISFQPSYPFEEGETGAKQYMQTRCPAWCDRVLLTKDALSLVKDGSEPASVEYALMGQSTCMGDHKPVYLRIELKSHHTAADEQKGGRTRIFWDGDGPPVKRVNSASMVETRDKRQDWQSARCNSDVSWNPAAAAKGQAAMGRTLLHGSSRIRLVSHNESVHKSLPRLTSHHSSSDEEWFEVVDSEEDLLEMCVDCIEEDLTERSTERIMEQLGTNESSKEGELGLTAIVDQVDSGPGIDEDAIEVNKAHFEANVVEVETKEREEAKDVLPVSIAQRLGDGASPESGKQTSKNFLMQKAETLLASMRRRGRRKNSETGSWETIDLSDPTQKVEEVALANRGCCCLQ